MALRQLRHPSVTRNRIAASRLNADPAHTQRSREHPTKTAHALKRIAFLVAKIDRLYAQLEACKTRWKQHRIARKLTESKKELLDLRALYAPKGSAVDPHKATPHQGDAP